MTTAATTPLEHALAYAARGWRVVPIPPGIKHPAIPEWQKAATTDAELIHQWWAQWPGHGVGIATGAATGLWVLDVDVSEGKQGHETLADLVATYGPLPDTVEVVTGSGGRHLYFRWPGNAEIRNDQAGRLGPGLDVRGEGGQVLAPPTIHPNGTPYAWEAMSDPFDGIAVAEAPAWLVELLTAPTTVAPRAERLAYTGDPRPGDIFAAGITWPELLMADGAAFVGERVDHRSGTRYELWSRPGADHTSATLYYGGTDVLKVFSSNWPGLRQDQTYGRFGYFVATRYGGDFARATAELRRAQDGDLAAWVGTTAAMVPSAAPAPTEPPQRPRLLEVRWVHEIPAHRTPEPPVLVEGLLRAGELAVFGAPRATGKTWLGFNLATLLAEGEGKFLGRLDVQRTARVLYLQGELDRYGSEQRWEQLTGIARPLPSVAESFDRWRVRVSRRRETTTEEGVTISSEFVEAVLDGRLEATVEALDVDLVVIDPWAVYFGGNENSNDEVEEALASLRQLMLRRGTAFVILHHIRKGSTDTADPEDLWRGASRLADWASTRVTLLPHYTPKQARQRGLERWQARRYVDAYFLRRSTPTTDFSVHLGPDGWWSEWVPDDDEDADPIVRKATASAFDLVAALANAGGELRSYREVADAIGQHHTVAKKVVTEAHAAGLVTIDKGPKGAPIVRLPSARSNGQNSRSDHCAPDRARADDARSAGESYGGLL